MTDNLRPARHLKYHPRLTITSSGLTQCEFVQGEKVIAKAFGGNRIEALEVTADLLDAMFEDEIERSIP